MKRLRAFFAGYGSVLDIAPVVRPLRRGELISKIDRGGLHGDMMRLRGDAAKAVSGVTATLLLDERARLGQSAASFVQATKRADAS
jgi:hypothetical protein